MYLRAETGSPPPQGGPVAAGVLSSCEAGRKGGREEGEELLRRMAKAVAMASTVAKAQQEPDGRRKRDPGIKDGSRAACKTVLTTAKQG